MGGCFSYSQVYEYVGDEIIVSWPAEVGLHRSRCVDCVLRMKGDLRERAPWFERHFGVIPDFKAGMQLGAVTTGEIGALKKQIVFTGDVLNQTARIQGLSDQLAVDVLVGDELAEGLTEADGWTLRSLGGRSLRGKEQDVELFALDLGQAEVSAG